MKIEEVKVGFQVVRSKGDYVVGRKGIILSTRLDHLGRNQVQVMWDSGPKTWVNINSVELTTIPYAIVLGGKYPKYCKI